jgi:2-polyprenyl-6-methoxyphenol hydroxylase-like FAD-dependent oxidoreductase
MSIRTDPSVTRGGHALVVGGSMAGLLAARVLADQFEQVTIVERDLLPEGVENRKVAPQGRHVHALLPRGLAGTERMSPGLVGELIPDGAIAFDSAAENRWYKYGGYRARFESVRISVMMSRPLLERRIRRRVDALPNVIVLPERDVDGLTDSEAADRARVTGVTLRRRRAENGTTETLSADLVVDVGGRGSRALAWMEALGYEWPQEERIKIGVGYTTRLYRRSSDDPPGARFAMIQPTPPQERRIGAMVPIEGEQWMVTLGGWLGDHAPTDEEGVVAFVRSLPVPDIYSVIREAEPPDEAVKFGFPANLRRRYEWLTRVPEGYLVTGDALCSFNPIYGQGMSVSTLKAETLVACLREGRDGLPRRVYRRVAKVVDVPWKLAAGADFAYPGVTGRRAFGNGAINWYVGQVQRAATRDPRVCCALVMVTALTSPPTTLFHPTITLRMIHHALGRRKEATASQAPERCKKDTSLCPPGLASRGRQAARYAEGGGAQATDGGVAPPTPLSPGPLRGGEGREG